MIERLHPAGASNPLNHGLDYDSLVVGQTYPGIVLGYRNDGVIVKLNEAVSGLVALTEMADDYDEIRQSESAWKILQPVRVTVKAIRVRSESKPGRDWLTTPIQASNPGNYGRLDLSLRTVPKPGTRTPVRDPEVKSLGDLHVGQRLRGFIKAATWPHGLYIQLAPRITGLVPLANVSDEYLKDFKGFTVRQLIEVKVSRITQGADSTNDSGSGRFQSLAHS